MKKILLLIIGLLLPMITFAAPNPDDYTTMNLVEAINGENDLLKNEEGYTYTNLTINRVNDTDDQVTIYAFIGFGCPHCHDFLSFLNDIAPEYDSKFKLVAFETWNTSAAPENNELMGELQDFLGTKVVSGNATEGYGVPVIMIGDNFYSGFGNTDSEKEAIKNSIDAEYEKKAKDRYDVFEEMKKAEKAESFKFINVIIWNAVVVTIATIIIIAYIHSQNNKIHDRIDAIYTKLGIEIENPEKKASLISIAKIDDDEIEEVKKQNDESEYEVKEEKEEKDKEATKKVTDSKKKKAKNKSKK